MQPYTIRQLALPASNEEIHGLTALLVDTVNAGGSVSFLAPLSPQVAEEWWRKTLASSGPSAVFLVACQGEKIIGSVQLHPAWAPNQPHRAEIAKLLVHPTCRRMGLATRLMQTVEEEARRAGFTLLTLDTRQGDAAEPLYRKLGWTEVGVIPGYALDPDAKHYHGTVVFYKEV